MVQSLTSRAVRRFRAVALALFLPFLASCPCKEEFIQYGYRVGEVDPACDVVEGGARATLTLEQGSVPFGASAFDYGTGTLVDAEVSIGGRAAADVVHAFPEVSFTVPEGAGPGYVDVLAELMFEVPRGPREKNCDPVEVSRTASLADGFLYYEGTRPVVTALTNVTNPGLPPCLEEDDDGRTVEVPSGCESGGETVLLDGVGFEEGDRVRFGDEEALEVIFGSDRQLYAVTPPGTAGEIVGVVVFRVFEVDPPEGADEDEESSTCILESIDPIRFCYTQCAAVTASPAANEAVYALAGTSPYLALGDVGGSPANDVVVASTNTSGGGLFEVLEGDGSGRLTSALTFALPGQPSDVVLADFEGDGDLDAAVSLVDLDQVAVLENDGGFDPSRLALVDCGIAAASGGLLGPDDPVALLALDYDGDGLLDLVVANEGSATIGVLQGSGSGSFGAALPMGIPVGGLGATPVAPSDLGAADLNGDGDVDLVVGDTAGHQIVTLENTSAGLPTSTVHGPVAVPDSGTFRVLALADFLGSGDLAVVDGDARLHLLSRPTTDYGFEEVWTVALEARDPVALELGDVFGSSGRDVVTACQPASLDVKASPPGATVELVTLSASTAGIVDLVLGVLNSGDPSTHDEAVVSFADGRIAVLLNQGDGYD